MKTHRSLTCIMDVAMTFIIHGATNFQRNTLHLYAGRVTTYKVFTSSRAVTGKIRQT